jgi:hypothetical protein
MNDPFAVLTDPANIDRGQRFWRWGRDKLRGQIEYLCPQQATSVFKSEDKLLSEWHIAIRVKDLRIQDEIRNCTIQAAWADFHERQWSPVYHLRWLSKQSRDGQVSQNLMAGNTYCIPIMRRDERDGNAIFLNEASYKNGNGMPLAPDRYVIKLAIKSGQRSWLSDIYFASVPDRDASNGLFYLQCIYDDQRPAQKWIGN